MSPNSVSGEGGLIFFFFFLVSPIMNTFLLCFHVVQRAKVSFSSTKDTDPFMTSVKPNLVPKGLPSNTIPLGLGASTDFHPVHNNKVMCYR